MARKPFVVIDAEILSSSVWSEAAHVKLVWLTMLVLCDTDGYVGAAVPGIARAAGVTLAQAEEALDVLGSPDPHSRTKAHEGRRIQTADRGWLILNFRDHLDRLSNERAKSRDRMRRHREKQRALRHGYVTVTAGSREQGTGNSEQGVGTKEEPPTSLPADVQGETMIRQSRVAQEREFYALVAQIAKAEGMDGADVARAMTSYQKDGKKVGGQVRPETLSDSRLERSLKDGREWLGDIGGKPSA